MNHKMAFLLLVLVGLSPRWASAAEGGLRLTGRALIAVPRANHTVFLSWRSLRQDGGQCSFVVQRSARPGGDFAAVGTGADRTAFVDSPGSGIFYYRVAPSSGELKGVFSNVARVSTDPKGHDWVEILPAMKGKSLQFSDRHFADTDGDGELEFITYGPQVPSYRGGQSPQTYKLQVYRLLDDVQPKWSFDTGMGRQSDPASGDFRADWDYEWTFKPVAWDIDGDYKAEIITLAKIDGEYRYVVLKDEGDRYRIVAKMASPVPVADRQNNSRHFPFFANLGGKNYSFCLQGGTYGAWEMWAYDWTGGELKLRWHVSSSEPSFRGNRSSSHTVLAADLDGDGKDEISNGATVLDDDGSVLWSANKEFGVNNHIDGQVIDDIDPGNPGLELMIHTEQGNKYALYDARSGKLLWLRQAPGNHLQLNIAARVSGRGLDVLGTFGGHLPKGTFACRHDGAPLDYPFPDKPLNGDRWWAMDWDGQAGRNVCMNFTRIYGAGGRQLYEVDLSDAPRGNVIPWNEHKLNHLWFNVDIVGDYREDIPVQMADGSVRVYLNTQMPPQRRVCKWQDRTYQLLQAPGDYRYCIVEGPSAP